MHVFVQFCNLVKEFVSESNGAVETLYKLWVYWRYQYQWSWVNIVVSCSSPALWTLEAIVLDALLAEVEADLRHNTALRTRCIITVIRTRAQIRRYLSTERIRCTSSEVRVCSEHASFIHVDGWRY